jgi:hypothetical protein
MTPINIQLSQLIEFINDIDMLATDMKIADEVIVFRLNSILDNLMIDFKKGDVNSEVINMSLAVYEDVKRSSNTMKLCQIEGRSIAEWSDSIKGMKARLKLLIMKIEGKF